MGGREADLGIKAMETRLVIENHQAQESRATSWSQGRTGPCRELHIEWLRCGRDSLKSNRRPKERAPLVLNCSSHMDSFPAPWCYIYNTVCTQWRTKCGGDSELRLLHTGRMESIPVIRGKKHLKVLLVNVLCNMESVRLDQVQISLQFFLHMGREEGGEV